MSGFLVKRRGALGDVFEATAIVARLRKENPDAEICFETDYPQVFTRSPNVTYAARLCPGAYDTIIDLDMAFEKRLRKIHPIDAYSLEAFGDTNTPHVVEYFDNLAVPRAGDQPMVVLHPARSWQIRTLPQEFWQAIADGLIKHGVRVCTTGTQQDWPLRNVYDCRNFTLQAQISQIGVADCFVCSESGPMIFAQTTDTPVVALLTMVPPEHVVHERSYSEISSMIVQNFEPIRAKVPCIGCATEQPTPVTFFDCMLKHRKCLTAFDVNEVVDAVVGWL